MVTPSKSISQGISYQITYNLLYNFNTKDCQLSYMLLYIHYCLTSIDFPKVKVVPPLEKYEVIISLYKNVKYE